MIHVNCDRLSERARFYSRGVASNDQYWTVIGRESRVDQHLCVVYVCGNVSMTFSKKKKTKKNMKNIFKIIY